MRGNTGGRIFQPKGRRVLMMAYYGPRRDGSWGEIRESARTEDPEVARGRLERRLRAVSNHREGIEQFQGRGSEKHTVAELLDALDRDYRTREIKGLRQALGNFVAVRAFFGADRAVAVTSDRVRRFVERRQKEGRANATINRGLEVLARAYRLAVEEKRIAAHFVPRIALLPERNARQGFFERDELEALLPHLPAPLDAMTRFAAICGWRLSEVLGLTWESVDHDAHEIRLRDSKNGEGRVLPLEGEDWSLVEELWTAREYSTPAGPGLSEYVFHRGGRPIPTSTFEHQWSVARKAANLPGKLFHDLRRTAARDMVRGGAPESFAMKITGHKTRSMFERYNIVSTDDMREALRRRRAHVNAQPSGGVIRFEGRTK